MENINLLLKEKNIKPNKYRIDILSYLKNTKEHPDAMKVFDNLKIKYPYIASATIYNTLNLFLETGLIISLKTKDDKVHFDANLEEHYHFVCEKCNKIIDIKDNNFFKKNINKIGGNIINKKIVYFFGICKSCLKNTNTKIKKSQDKIIFEVKKLKNNFDLNIIKNTLKNFPEIKSIKINISKQIVTITGHIVVKEIEKEFRKIGY